MIVVGDMVVDTLDSDSPLGLVVESKELDGTHLFELLWSDLRRERVTPLYARKFLRVVKSLDASEKTR